MLCAYYFERVNSWLRTGRLRYRPPQQTFLSEILIFLQKMTRPPEGFSSGGVIRVAQSAGNVVDKMHMVT
jgi:hypothetical protein